jgi:hypothetical protein
MGDRDSRYPDISDILARKAAGRLAKRSGQSSKQSQIDSSTTSP